MEQSRVTLAGTVGQDPEQRTTAGGAEVVRFRLAVTERVRQGADGWADGPTSWFQVNAWGTLGRNAAASIRKGQRVLVHGALTVREYQSKDGAKGKEAEVRATSIGHDLTFGTSRFERAAKAQPAPAPAAAPVPVQAAQQVDHSNEWAAPGTTDLLDDPGEQEPPF